jgi:hypothetical protein
MRRAGISLVLICLCTAADAQQPTAALPEAELKALIRDSVRFLDEKNNKTAEYAYTVRNHRRQFDANGKVTLEESVVLQRTFQDGFGVSRVTERNGKPLSAAEKRDEDDRIAARVAESKSETGRKKARQEVEWAREVPEAMRYRLAAEETVDGRRCWVVDAEPNPNYRPKNMQARVFEKLKGRFWIDKTDRELVKGEAETFDTVSIGMGLLARVEKGTRFAIRRVKLPDGNWVTESHRLKFGARVMLFKRMSNEIETRHSDFRHKSQVSTVAAR